MRSFSRTRERRGDSRGVSPVARANNSPLISTSRHRRPSVDRRALRSSAARRRLRCREATIIHCRSRSSGITLLAPPNPDVAGATAASLRIRSNAEPPWRLARRKPVRARRSPHSDSEIRRTIVVCSWPSAPARRTAGRLPHATAFKWRAMMSATAWSPSPRARRSSRKALTSTRPILRPASAVSSILMAKSNGRLSLSNTS